MNPLKALTAWAKQFRMRHPVGSGTLGLLLNRTRYNYGDDVDSLSNSAVVACIRWVQRTFPEAPLVLERRSTASNDWEVTDNDPFLEQLDRPNPYYDGLTLWTALIADLLVTGNAYILKARNSRGRAVELWWAPSGSVEPWFPSDGSEYISHYEYRPDGLNTVNVAPEDIVHLRDGIDAQNTRKGLSPLRSLMREVFTDDEASNMTAALMRNMGVPGVVIAPGKDSSMSQEGANTIKEWFSQSFSGDKRGTPLVLSAEVGVNQFGFSPEQMTLRELRKIPEERIAAVIGVPAVVAGLGAGLDRSTFANYAEAREAAYESLIIPLQRNIASQLQRQLLTDYHSDIRNWRVRFDLSDVRVLQEDANNAATRIRDNVLAGILSVAEGRRELGFDAEPEHEVYYVPQNLQRRPVGTLGDEPEPPPELPAENLTNGREQSAYRPYAKASAEQQQNLVLRLSSDADQLMTALGDRVRGLFADLGERAAEAYLQREKSATAEQKQNDAVLTEQIITSLGLDGWQRQQFSPVIRAHYLVVGETTYASVGAMLGVDLNLDDEMSRRVLAEGGRRAGLVDIDRAAREALFRTLSEARTAGLGVEETGRRIRDVIPAGRWRTASQRAEVIARTETAFAQRLSSLGAYRTSGVVERVEMLDAQLEQTDQECEDRNGRVVNISEAEQHVMEEHPNGTLTIVPAIT